jgi:hypothetical protein
MNEKENIPNELTQEIIDILNNSNSADYPLTNNLAKKPEFNGEIQKHIDYLVSRGIISQFEPNDKGNWFIKKDKNFGVVTTQFDSIQDYESYLRSIESEDGNKKKLEVELIMSNMRVNSDAKITNKATRDHINKIESYNTKVISQTNWIIRLSALSLLLSCIVGFYVVKDTYQEDRIYLVPQESQLKLIKISIDSMELRLLNKIEVLEHNKNKIYQDEKKKN